MYTQATDMPADAEGSLHWQEGVAYRKLDTEGLQVVESRSLGLLKLPWELILSKIVESRRGRALPITK